VTAPAAKPLRYFLTKQSLFKDICQMVKVFEVHLPPLKMHKYSKWILRKIKAKEQCHTMISVFNAQIHKQMIACLGMAGCEFEWDKYACVLGMFLGDSRTLTCSPLLVCYRRTA
jgi:hypothetical protein